MKPPYVYGSLGQSSPAFSLPCVRTKVFLIMAVLLLALV